MSKKDKGLLDIQLTDKWVPQPEPVEEPTLTASELLDTVFEPIFTEQKYDNTVVSAPQQTAEQSVKKESVADEKPDVIFIKADDDELARAHAYRDHVEEEAERPDLELRDPIPTADEDEEIILADPDSIIIPTKIPEPLTPKEQKLKEKHDAAEQRKKDRLRAKRTRIYEDLRKEEEARKKREKIRQARLERIANTPHKPSLTEELAQYGYTFIWIDYAKFFLLAALVVCGLAYIYKLQVLMTVLTLAACLALVPSMIKQYYRNKYEENKFEDVTTYIEQMLYSFRRNGKIMASLYDVQHVFRSGEMRDCITAAIALIQTSDAEKKDGTIRFDRTGTQIYADALSCIERQYSCRRIRTLHRYLLKVENVGGTYDDGINALLRDRRLWIDRIDDYKRQRRSAQIEIITSTLFSLGMGVLTVMFLPDLVNIFESVIYQILTGAFIFLNVLCVRAMLHSTVMYIEDESERDSAAAVKRLNWLRTYSTRHEILNSLKFAAIFMVFLFVGLLINNTTIIILAAVLIAYALIGKRLIDKSLRTKSTKTAIEVAYPNWLLELTLLLQVDNLHVAIDKTIPDAPAVIRGDLETLNEDIAKNPTSLEPFAHFLEFLDIPTIHSSMNLLYSISEFSTNRDRLQLTELVERNNALMNKAEMHNNQTRLAGVFMLKFVPTLLVTLKMVIDMGLFLFMYMSSMTIA